MSFYCKNCGTELNVDGQKIAVCDFCGMEQTLPTANDEQLIELFAKANEQRRENHFDIAKKQYESIIAQYPDENEAYWCKLLCEYGIEYVEDDLTEKKLPTCHRTNRESIFDNKDYKLIIARASVEEKAIYKAEAKEIDRIQKEILAKAEKEEPFDIFICYKETDEKGARTRDSQIATKIYSNLTGKGYKVFFARVTLKELAGSKYEPVIYSALTSAKVMLIVTTSKEHVNAPWVRNEWSRYVEFMQSDFTKSIVPCISVMDAYDLPKELSEFQALVTTDMDFLENLTRQIDSKFGKNAVIQKEDTVLTAHSEENQIHIGNNIQTLLKRIKIFLINSEWEKADEYAEKVLDIDPECGEAYLGKLLVEQKVSSKEQLKDCANPFDNSKNYQMIMMFASDSLKQEIKGYVDYIKERNENARKQGIYERATSLMLSAKTESDYKEAGKVFESIKGYKDAQALATECYDKAEEVRKNAVYDKAKKTANENTIESYEKAIAIYKSIIDWKDSSEQIEYCNKRIEEIKEKAEENRKIFIYNQAKAGAKGEDISSYEKSIQLYKSIIEWRDSKEQIEYCEKRIEEINKKKEERRKREEQERIERERIKKRNKKIAVIVSSALACVVVFIIVLFSAIIPSAKYTQANELYNAGKYEEAASVYESLNGWGDSATKAKECKYTQANELYNAGKYEEAASMYESLNGWGDSATKEKEIWGQHFQDIVKVSQVGDIVKLGAYEQDNSTPNGKEIIEWRVLSKEDNRVLLISKYALDCKRYNETLKDITWETCSLRKWLNNDFINSAFGDAEKAIIPTVTVSADKHPSDSTNHGNATQDKVFLLSITEANKYFSSSTARQCKPTAYAKKNGAYVNSDNGNCW